MSSRVEPKKQIAIFVPLAEWRAVRAEAARQNIPMTELCRRWLSPEVAKLPQSFEWRGRLADQSPLGLTRSTARD